MTLVCVAERHGLRDQRKTEEFQLKIIDSLKDHCTYNADAQKKPQLFSNILGKMPELRSVSREALQCLYYYKLDGHELPSALDVLLGAAKM